MVKDTSSTARRPSGAAGDGDENGEKDGGVFHDGSPVEMVVEMGRPAQGELGLNCMAVGLFSRESPLALGCRIFLGNSAPRASRGELTSLGAEALDSMDAGRRVPVASR